MEGGASHMTPTGASGKDEKRIDYVIGISNMTWPGIMAVMSGFANLTAAGMKATNVMNSAMGRFEGALLAAGGAAAIGIGLATAEAAKFEREMKVVQALIMETGASSGELKQKMEAMAASAKSLAVEYGKTPEEVAKGFQVLGRAGLETTEEMTQTMKAALQLAVIEGITAEEASTMAIQLTTLFGGDMQDDVAKFAEILAHAANVSTVSAKEIMTGMTHAGGIAASIYPSATVEDMYKNASDMAAMVATLSQKGVSGKMAGVAVKSFINYMVKDMPKSIRALKKIGLKPDDLMEFDPESGEKVFLKPLETIELFEKQFAEHGIKSRAEKYKWLMEWGEPRQAQQYIKLFPEYDVHTGQQEWLLKKYTDEMEEEYNTQERVNVVMESASQKIAKMGSALQVLMVNVGSIYLPVLGALASALEAIAKIASENPFISWGIGLGTLTLALSGLGVIIKWLAPALFELKGSAGLLKQGKWREALFHGKEGEITYKHGGRPEWLAREASTKSVEKETAAVSGNTGAVSLNSKVKAATSDANFTYASKAARTTEAMQAQTAALIENAAVTQAHASMVSGGLVTNLGMSTPISELSGARYSGIPIGTPLDASPKRRRLSGDFNAWLGKNTLSGAERTYLKRRIISGSADGTKIPADRKSELNKLIKKEGGYWKLVDAQHKSVEETYIKGLREANKGRELHRKLMSTGITQHGYTKKLPPLPPITPIAPLNAEVGAGARGNIWGIDRVLLDKKLSQEKPYDYLKAVGKIQSETKELEKLQRIRNQKLGPITLPGGATRFAPLPPLNVGAGTPAYPGIIPAAAWKADAKQLLTREQAYAKGVKVRQGFLTKIKGHTAKLTSLSKTGASLGAKVSKLGTTVGSKIGAAGAGAAGFLGLTGPQALAIGAAIAVGAGVYYIAKSYGLLETGEAKFNRALKTQKTYVDHMFSKKTGLIAREAYLQDLQKKGIQLTEDGKKVSDELTKSTKERQEAEEEYDVAKHNYDKWEKWGKKIKGYTKGAWKELEKIEMVKIAPPESEDPLTKRWTDKMKKKGGLDLSEYADGMQQQAKILANILETESKITKEKETQATMRGKYFNTPEGQKKLIKSSQTAKDLYINQMMSMGYRWNAETKEWEKQHGLGYIHALAEGSLGKAWVGAHYAGQTGEASPDQGTRNVMTGLLPLFGPLPLISAYGGSAEEMFLGKDLGYYLKIKKQEWGSDADEWDEEKGTWGKNIFEWGKNLFKGKKKETTAPINIQNATIKIISPDDVLDFGAKLANFINQNPAGNAPQTGD